MQGGLQYLKEVIIDDKLGICSELESEMASLVDTYECEWKTTINDPEKLKRFNHFINADNKDNNVVFVSERGQKRPASDLERINVHEVAREVANA